MFRYIIDIISFTYYSIWKTLESFFFFEKETKIKKFFEIIIFTQTQKGREERIQLQTTFFVSTSINKAAKTYTKMSNQSGITADQQLLNILNNSRQENEYQYFIIVAKISQDSTAVEVTGQYTSLEQLENSLADEPVYIFIRDFKKDPNHYAFISFVPDDASVRSKMLYASTKNTLLREIGTNILGQQVLCTEPNDIDDLVNQTEINKSSLLTESEKITLEINEQQRQMKSQIRGHQLVSQTNGTKGYLNFEVIIDSSSLTQQLNSTNLVSFKIDIPTEKVEIANKKNISKPQDIGIITEHPSYTIYKNGDLIYFIYACPSGSKVKDRMLYASNRSGFLKYLQEEQGLSFTKILEIGEPDELEISLISNASQEELKKEEEEEEANNTTVKRFNRPKGPGRRSRN